MGDNLKPTHARKVFAANLRRIREAAEVSQERLAELAGFHRTYISAVENCKRNVSLDNLDKMARALKVKPAKLLEE